MLVLSICFCSLSSSAIYLESCESVAVGRVIALLTPLWSCIFFKEQTLSFSLSLSLFFALFVIYLLAKLVLSICALFFSLFFSKSNALALIGLHPNLGFSDLFSHFCVTKHRTIASFSISSISSWLRFVLIKIIRLRLFCSISLIGLDCFCSQLSDVGLIFGNHILFID